MSWPVFVFALLAGGLLTFGSRSQLLVAQLHAQSRTNFPLLAIAWVAAIISALLAACLGDWVGLNLPPEALAIMLAVAALWAAYDLVRTKPPKPIAEPNSIGGRCFLRDADRHGSG